MNAVNLDSLFGAADGTDPQADPVSLTTDLDRIVRLPQRDAEPLGAAIAEPLSRRLRLPRGTMTLKPLQALALAEAFDLRGLLALLPVGGGKTLITFLLPVLLQLKAVLLVPAGLEPKTERDFNALALHWQRPRLPVISYELISRNPELLTELDPDLLIADEADCLKNTKAACTRRVHRFVNNRAKADKRVAFCALSGTMTSRSFRDWWHIQQWSLPPALHPLPYSYPVMLAWSQALDEKIRARRPTGQLYRLVDEKVPHASLDQIRTAFGKRLRATPGVIGTDTVDVKSSLRIKTINHSIPEITDALNLMRRTWETPDGVEFSEASELWRHARELANGFYYKWDPLPPKWWLEPRREFHAFVRSILSGSRTLDTMKQVKDVHATEPAVTNWLAVKDDYEPNTVPVWLTYAVIDYAVNWARDTGGLVWVEHKAVGYALERAGLPYFGEGGLNSAGVFIEEHNGPAAVSSIACRRGLNLQYKWHNNLILNWQPVGRYCEQLVGRTHRAGQPADVVNVILLFTVREQIEGFAQARRDAVYIEQTTDQRQKLVFADYL